MDTNFNQITLLNSSIHLEQIGNVLAEYNKRLIKFLMNQVVQPFPSVVLCIDIENSVEILVQINEALDALQRDNLVSALKNSKGVIGAEFFPQRYHLMLVRYDKDIHDSRDILLRIKSLEIHAQLIGMV